MDFLKTFRNDKPGSVKLEPYGAGFLRLTYDDGGELLEATWVRTKTGSAEKNLHLYFDWANDSVTCKTPSGLSGVQWCDGYALLGTVSESDGDDDADQGVKIGLNEWIEECLGKMTKDS